MSAPTSLEAVTLPHRDAAPTFAPRGSAKLSAADWPVIEVAPNRAQRGTLIVLTSGRVRSIDDMMPDAVLLRRVADVLAAVGVSTLNPTLPIREDGLSDDDSALIRLRADLGAAVLNRLDRTSGPVIVLGFSLGAQSALALAEDWLTSPLISGLVLVSGVIERPTAPVGGIRFVDLVHGSRDYIAYLAPGDHTVQRAIPPAEHSRNSAARLVLGPRQSATVSVLPNLGHALDAVTVDGTRNLAAGVTALSERLAARFEELNIRAAEEKTTCQS